MLTTTFHDPTVTYHLDGTPHRSEDNHLLPTYDGILHEQQLKWKTLMRFDKLLGAGGQGVVYLSQLGGADGFTLPIAVKIYSPERFRDADDYNRSMERAAQVAAHVAQIQQDNLIKVQNFVDLDGIRCMVMEWIDGYDLRRLLTPMMLERVRHRVDQERWEYINRVVVTDGPIQPRLKAGVAMAIVRDCLSALGALHREGVVHGDIKPSNIMLKRMGHAKIVDIGSAFELTAPPLRRTCTPCYSAPEVLDGQPADARSDLASLGYVLIELLAGQPAYLKAQTKDELLIEKHRLPSRLKELLPHEVTCNLLLMNFINGLIAPNPQLRFESAEAADLLKEGAVEFQRQLIRCNLASEYDNEIRHWLQELDDSDDGNNNETELQA